MGDLFESGIRALLNIAEAQQKLPCSLCEKEKLHSPFYCANFYDQESKEFIIPSEKPFWTEQWIKENEGSESENGITFLEVERYKNHFLHTMSREEERYRRAERMEVILAEFDVVADALNLRESHELRVRRARIRNFEIRDLKSGKEPEYHHSENVHDCKHLLNEAKQIAKDTIEYYSRKVDAHPKSLLFIERLKGITG